MQPLPERISDPVAARYPVRAGLADHSVLAQHMDGSEMMKLVGWAQSVVPSTVALLNTLMVWRLSSVCTGAGDDVILAVPVLTSGAHLSVPVEYLTRKYQLVRARH